MNTNEKRKLEALVSGKLSTAREIFQNRRKSEYEGLVLEVENKPSSKVEELVAKAEKLQAMFIAQSSALKADALALGYNLATPSESDDTAHAVLKRVGRWVNGCYENAYTEPTLSAHEQATNDVLAKIDDISARYSVEIWSDGADMKKLFDQFEKEIQKTIA